jgi:hypothetical protein
MALFLLRGGLWIFFQSIRVSEFGGTRRCAAVRPRKGCRERIPDGNRGPDGKYPSQKGVRCVLRRAPMSPTRRIPGLKCETWGTLLLVMTEPLVSTPSQLLDTRVRGGRLPVILFCESRYLPEWSCELGPAPTSSRVDGVSTGCCAKWSSAFCISTRSWSAISRVKPWRTRMR